MPTAQKVKPRPDVLSKAKQLYLKVQESEQRALVASQKLFLPPSHLLASSQKWPHCCADLFLSPSTPCESFPLGLMLTSACLSFQNPVVSQISSLNPAFVCQRNLFSIGGGENKCLSLSFDSRVQGRGLEIIKPEGPSRKREVGEKIFVVGGCPQVCRAHFSVVLPTFYIHQTHSHYPVCPHLRIRGKVKAIAKPFGKQDSTGFSFKNISWGPRGDGWPGSN